MYLIGAGREQTINVLDLPEFTGDSDSTDPAAHVPTKMELRATMLGSGTFRSPLPVDYDNNIFEDKRHHLALTMHHSPAQVH